MNYIFENSEFGSVRMVDVDGKIYFVANDVAKALGYSVSKDVVTRHCKGGVETTLPYRRRRTRDESYPRARDREEIRERNCRDVRKRAVGVILPPVLFYTYATSTISSPQFI